MAASWPPEPLKTNACFSEPLQARSANRVTRKIAMKIRMPFATCFSTLSSSARQKRARSSRFQK